MDRAWGRSSDDKVAKAYDLRSEWRSIKEQYDQYLTHFVLVRNAAAAAPPTVCTPS
jgi:hypothetical protein